MAEERRKLGGRFEPQGPCAHPGCPEPGEYRAPLRKPGSRFVPTAGPPEWQYFCLEHVRAFNAQWNWFEGLDAEEIWQAQSPWPRWEREVEAFARHGDPRRKAAGLDDPLGILRWKAGERPAQRSKEDLRALATLGLDPEATLADVKARYRELARRYHPDTNRGDRRHEGRLQAATDAHAHLTRSLGRRSRPGG